ncbi:MAG: prolyl oligopeptidase family serine peptidase, partial [Bacteroidetes bacterium]|nr:prolyl oligopeptidase family serine peptidase [Bacteroidota bacterium]
YCTFGHFEKHDVSLWIDKALDLGLNDNIGVWGQSLGGAIGLQALAIDNRLKFGIIESTFADLRTIAHGYIDRTVPFLSNWYKNLVINLAANKADFKPDLVVPASAARSINAKVLLVHGQNDERIPCQNADLIFENLPKDKCQKIIVENANHVNVWPKGGEDYFKQVFQFI